MDRKRRTRVSKLMSLALRHAPQTLELRLDEAGWVDVSRLLAGLAAKGEVLSDDDLAELVRTNEKQRFALSPDRTRIRANQGHSVDIDLGLDPSEPPTELFHGTSLHAVPLIRRDGLLRMGRTHVHLSSDEATAQVVARRRSGDTVLLRVNAGAMHRDGHLFFRSENGVWLTEAVPAHYLRFPDA